MTGPPRAGRSSSLFPWTPMSRYILRRLAGMFLLLILVSAVTFIIFNVFPATDPAALRAGRQPTPEVIETIREDLGLDRPLIVQFGDYIWQVFAHQDFGRSYVSNVDVLEQIRQNLPATISLTIGGVVVWLFFGLSAGILSAVRHRSLFDRLAIGLSLIATSASSTGSASSVARAPTRRSPRTRSSGSGRSCCRGSCSRRRSPRSTRGCCAARCWTCSARTTSAPRAPRAWPSAA